MKIHFTDGLAEASGFRFFQEKNGNGTDRVLGSTGLLDFFELHLGLAGPKEAEQSRLIALRNFLKQVILPGHPFHESFTKNEFALCIDLLKLYDHLIMLRWKGNFNETTPRLELLAASKQVLKNHPGEGDRWMALYDYLIVNPFPSGIVDKILVYDQKEWLHPFLRELLALPGIPDVKFVLPCELPDSGNNLCRLRNMFQTRNFGSFSFKPLKEDNSLVVIRSNSSMAAADLLHALALQGNTLLVDGGQGVTLDAIASRITRPLSGFSEGSVNNAVNMLPFQLVNILKDAPNALLILSFLNNAACPVDYNVRFPLRRVLMKKPGFDVEFWINEIIEDLKQNGVNGPEDQPESLVTEELVRKEIYRWFRQPEKAIYQGNKYMFSKSMLIHLFEKTSKELKGKNFDGAVQLLKIILQLLNDYEGEMIDETQLTILISGNLKPVSNPMFAAQAGCIPTVGAPSSVISAFNTIIWWNLSEDNGVAGATYFYLAETKELSGNSLWSNEYESSVTDKWYFQSIRPLVNCHERLILVVTETSNGEKMLRHPFFDFIEASCKNMEEVTVHAEKDPEGVPEQMKVLFRNSKLVPAIRKSLPIAFGNWNINTELPTLRDKESFSSLEKLICYPHQYIMEKMACLKYIGPPDPDNILQNCGNAAHRVFELLFTREDSLKLKDESLEGVTSALCEQVIREQYIGLNTPESGLLKKVFIRKILRAASRLLEHLKAGNFVKVFPEVNLGKETPIEFGGILLNGKIDLLLTARDGRKAIIDLKWTGFSKRQKMLKEEKDLQLTVYSYLVSSTADIPTAFFIIDKSRLISYESDLFPHATVVFTEKEGRTIRAEMAEKTQHAYKIRVDEFSRGFIEVGLEAEYDELAQNSLVWKGQPEGAGFPKIYTSDTRMMKKKPVDPYSVYNVFTPLK